MAFVIVTESDKDRGDRKLDPQHRQSHAFIRQPSQANEVAEPPITGRPLPPNHAVHANGKTVMQSTKR